MGNVVLFPRKKELPTVVKEMLRKAARDYMEAMYIATEILDIRDISDSEYEELVEWIALAYGEALIEAADEILEP